MKDRSGLNCLAGVAYSVFAAVLLAALVLPAGLIVALAILAFAARSLAWVGKVLIDAIVGFEMLAVVHGCFL